MKIYKASDFLTAKQILYVNSHPVAKIIKLLSIVGDTRIVGGAVRDMILQLEVQDFDVATALIPQQVIQILHKNHITLVATGIQFGNIIAIIDNCKIDINTLRKDTVCLGRKAHVEFTQDFQIDANRRDFTINSLSYCIKSQHIFDYLNGIHDIQNRKIVFIGDAYKRIQEDYLRIMRFFRFCSMYGADFNLEIVNICAQNIRQMIQNVSKDRIKNELDLILERDRNAHKVLCILHDKLIFEDIFCDLKLDLSNLDSIYKIINSAEVNANLSYKTKRLVLYACLFMRNDFKLISNSLKLTRFSKYEINFILFLLKFYFDNSVKLDVKNCCNENNYYKIFLKAWYVYSDIQVLIGIIVFFSSFYNIECSIINECILYFLSNTKKQLPITGYDIMHRVKDKKKIKLIINKLIDCWIESEFNLDKKDLYKKLNFLLDSM